MSKVTDTVDDADAGVGFSPKVLSCAVLSNDAELGAALEAALRAGAATPDALRRAVSSLVAARGGAWSVASALVWSQANGAMTYWDTRGESTPARMLNGVAAIASFDANPHQHTTLPSDASMALADEPLWGAYRGHAVYLPPSLGEARVLAAVLSLLEELPLVDLPVEQVLHTGVEALGVVRADAARTDDIESLLDPARVERWVTRIGERASARDVLPPPSQGTFCVVVDGRGDACVLSLARTRELLPLPFVVDRGGRPWLLGAADGVAATTLVQVLLRLVDAGLEPTEALAAARVELDVGFALAAESGLDEAVREALASRGHVTTVVPALSGVCHALEIDAAFERAVRIDPRGTAFAAILPPTS